MVTLLQLGVGAGEADGMSFKKNLSKSDTVSLVAAVATSLAPLCCGRVAEVASTGDVALASWNPPSVEVGCCTQGGSRSKMYG